MIIAYALASLSISTTAVSARLFSAAPPPLPPQACKVEEPLPKKEWKDMKCPDSQTPKSDEYCISRGWKSYRAFAKCEIETEEVKPSSSAIVCGLAGQTMASQTLESQEVDFSIELGPFTGDEYVIEYTHEIPEGTINEHPHRDYCDA